MKNLKKVLSLVMALAMAMSLMATAFAADVDFSDKAEIENTEAVEVMTALGVMQGNNGKFDPNGTLTREQAAKIITYMVLGKEDADKLTADVAMYSDVKADRWSAGAIAYCTNERIMVGNGKGKFNPTAKLTGQQFAKTLLVALGYNPKIENLEGNSWAINTSKMATTTGLSDSIGALSIPMTREKAAQMAFNALTATLVEYRGGTEVTTPDGTNVTVGAIRYDVANSTNDGYLTTKGDNDLLMQFCERYQPKLALNNKGSDDYGRTANKWIFKGKTVGTYSDAADIVYTKEMKEADVKSDVKDYSNYNSASEKIVVTTNGNDAAAAQLDAKAIADLTKNGTTVEIFVDNNKISKIAVLNSVFGEVTSVNTKDETITIKTEAAQAGGYAAAATLTTEEGYNTFKKGDKVIITAYDKGQTTLKNSATITSVVAPKVVTGKATGKNTTDKTIKLDGTTYEVSGNTTIDMAKFGVSTKYDATLYLDAEGYVIAGEAGSAATDDSAVVVKKEYASLDKDGKIVNMFEGVLSSGEVVNWKWETTKPAAGTVYTYKDADNDDEYELTLVSATSFTKDGDVVKVASVSEITKATKSLSIDGKTVYFDSNVKFVFFKGEKATVLDGVQKVAAGTETYFTIKKDGNTWYATSVLANTTVPNSTSTSDDIIYLVKETGTTVVTNNATNKAEEFATYEAYINGAEVKDFYAESGKSAGFYSAEKDNDTGAYVLTNNTYAEDSGKLAVVKDQKVTGVANDIVTASKDFDTKSATFVDITDEKLTSASDIESVMDKKDVTVSVIYDADTNNASYVYVTKVENKVVAPSQFSVKDIQVTYAPTANTSASVVAAVKTVKVNKDAKTFDVELQLTSATGLAKAIQIDTVNLTNSYTATAPASGDEVFAAGASTSSGNTKTVSFTLDKGMTSDIDTLTITLKEGA